MSKKTMKLALEALEYIHEGANNQGPHTGISWRCVSNKAEPAITALREALASEAIEQPAQRTWGGLTTADPKEIERQSVYVEGAIRLTEAKLKEKNNGN